MALQHATHKRNKLYTAQNEGGGGQEAKLMNIRISLMSY